MNEKRAQGCLIAAVLWCLVLAVLGLGYRFLVHPHVADQLRRATSGSDAYRDDLVIAADSFSGYCLLRSETLRQNLKERKIRLTVQDDGADYAARLEALRTGQVQLAAFTIDSLLATGARAGDFPGTIILVLDETQGADAIVAYESGLKNLQDLDDPSARIVFTPNSPSEFLARVVLAHFQLPRLSEDWSEPVDGADVVLERFRTAEPRDRRAFVLWEPVLSRALQVPGAHVLLDSSKVRGLIVDVLVARRQLLVERPDLAKAFVEAYAQTAYRYAQEPDGMVRLVVEDARKAGGVPMNEEQARRLVQGIHWKNLLENYAHFGLTQGVQAGGLPSLPDMISRVLDVLIQTRALAADPLGGQPNTLFYDQLLGELRAERFHPAQGLQLVSDLGPTDSSEQLTPPPPPATLTAEQWQQLQPVGELRTPPIEFQRGSATVSLSGERDLQALARRLQSFPHLYLRVVGQARPEGDPEANRRLAQARAEAAVAQLVQEGLAPERLRAETTLPTTAGSQAQTVVFVVGQLPY